MTFEHEWADRVSQQVFHHHKFDADQGDMLALVLCVILAFTLATALASLLEG